MPQPNDATAETLRRLAAELLERLMREVEEREEPEYAEVR